MDFGQKIKKLRLEANLTQKELADKMNVSFQTISKWEGGINEPDMQSIKDLAKIFNVSVEYLFSENDEINKDELRNKNLSFNTKIGECRNCHKPIFDNEEYKERTVQGEKCIYCSDCDKEIFKEENDINNGNNLDKNKIGICSVCSKDIYDNEVYDYVYMNKESKLVCKNCYDRVKKLKLDDDSNEFKSNRASIAPINKNTSISNSSIEKKEEQNVIKLQTTVCNCCNKPIYAGEKTFNVMKGSRGHRVGLTYCENCYKEKLEKERKEKEEEDRKTTRFMRIVATIFSLIYLAIVFYFSITQREKLGLPLTIALPIIWTYATIAFIYCVGVNEVVQDIFEFFFLKTIKLPGIIFSFDLDGFKFLVFMKILFGLIGLLFTILMNFLSVFFASIISMFVFIPTIIKNSKK